MKSLLRTWKEFDLKEVEKHLIVMGELSAECFSCHKVGIEAKTAQCPQCGAHFKYMGFRRKLNMNYLHKLKEELPYMTFIDFDDFKRATGKSAARNLLDL